MVGLLLAASAAAWCWPWWWAAVGVVVATVSGFLLGSLAYSYFTPRLAYVDGELLVYLGAREPTHLPIDLVECFFRGQGASQLPPVAGREPETINVIVRLAESAHEWRHRDVDLRFAHWCEGYITLSGAWCEPIDNAALLNLNRRLVEVQRRRKQSIVQAAAEIRREPA